MYRSSLEACWVGCSLGSLIIGPLHRRQVGHQMQLDLGALSAASTERVATGTPSRLASLAKSAPEKLSL